MNDEQFANARDNRLVMDEELLAGRGFNYYQALGISSSASSREVREAYRSTVRMASPRKMDQSTSAYYRYLGEALDVLTNESLRQAYDESLGDVEALVTKRFSPSSVVFPDLGTNPNTLLPFGKRVVLPKGIGKIAGLMFSLLACVGLGLSAWAIPDSNAWVTWAWLSLIGLSVLFLYFHPNIGMPMLSRSWVIYGLLGYMLILFFLGEVSPGSLEVALGGGVLIAGGLMGVGEWWRNVSIRKGLSRGFSLSEDFILSHKEMGGAGESWRMLARKGKVPQASMTKETFTQQLTADILMRLTAASGVRLINGVDIGTFVPHVLVAGNKVAVVEGLIVDSGEHSITSRGVICSEQGVENDDSMLSGVPTAVPLVETLRRGMKVQGWVLLISRDGGPIKVAYKSDNKNIRMGEAKVVLEEIAEFFKEDDSFNVVDLRIINALWSRKTAE